MRVLLDVRHQPAGTECVCHGPVDGNCPLLAGDGCSQFEQADGVVFGLDLDVPVNREVLAHYRALRPHLPIFVITTAEAADRWSDELEGFTVVTKEQEITALLSQFDPDPE